MDNNVTTPKISILLCTYNRAFCISKAIKSVLTQSFSDWELLILDDASTDNTADVIKPFLNDKRIVYVRHEKNMGIAGNRNYGLQIAKGEYIAILDSDDAWLDTKKLSTQIKFLEENPTYVLVGTHIILSDKNNRPTKKITFEETDEKIRSFILSRNQFAQSTILYKKETALLCGGYDATFEICDDYDLWLKMGLQGKVANLRNYSTMYLNHTTGITKLKKIKAAIETKEIIKKFKGKYPNYPFAIIKAHARIILSALNII